MTPATTSRLWFALRSFGSRSVPIKALLVLFGMMISPAIGCASGLKWFPVALAGGNILTKSASQNR